MARRIFLVSLVWALGALATLAQQAAQKHSKPSGDAVGRVPDRALMQAIQDAWATLNPAEAAKYYDKSAEDTFFDDAGGLKFVGWQAYEDAMRKVMGDEQSARWIVNDDAVVHQAGNYAWGTATVHTEMTCKNGHQDVMDERRTLIWIVVHEHFSAAPS